MTVDREQRPLRVNGLRIAGLVLAAGSSRRLGRPKQLLPYQDSTLLGTTLNRVRGFALEQRIVALGGAGDDVREGTDLSGFHVVDNVHHSSGCSSSIVAALAIIEADMDGFLLFLGDQPEIPPEAVSGLREAAAGSPMAVVSYRDGLGHPFWFARSLFGELAGLHGDKAVWKLLESGRRPVTEVPIDAAIPLDVDTWDDYERIRVEHGS